MRTPVEDEKNANAKTGGKRGQVYRTRVQATPTTRRFFLFSKRDFKAVLRIFPSGFVIIVNN